MNRSLEDFESWVSKSILSKGEDYWVDDNVQNLEQDGETWAADVYGTDNYLTEVTIKNGQVAEWFCDCPYDHGPICKHVVAVLFAVRDEIPDELLTTTEVVTSATNKTKSAKQKTTPSNPIEEIIEKLAEPELRRLITYFAGRQDEVRSHLLSKYAHLLEVVSKTQYEQLVSSYIDAHSGGRHGFLEYRDASRLGDKIYTLVENADSKNPMAVAYLCEAVIRQLAKAYQHADDSSGSMGGAMETAFSSLYNLAEPDNDYPIEVVNYIFEYAIGECNKEAYQGWDWGRNLRSLACDAVRDKEQAAEVMEVLDQSITANKKKEHREYDIEASERLKLYLLRDHYSLDTADKHLKSNLHYSSFRKMALEQAMEEKRYEDVRRLAEEGIVQHTGKYAGLVNDWKKWLIRLSKVTGDTTSFIKINEELFFGRGEMEYYRKLKEIIPKDEFKDKVETYIQYFRKREDERWGPTFNQYVATILEEENRLEDLMNEIKKAASLRRLDHYFDLLGKHYKGEFLALYEKLVRQHMDTNTGRGIYIECCQYIDKIVRLGGLEDAKMIVEDWRKKYPRRRAMMEELARYKW